jgi:hypothetical protein
MGKPEGKRRILRRGVARFFDSRDEQKNWQPLREITNFLKTTFSLLSFLIFGSII